MSWPLSLGPVISLQLKKIFTGPRIQTQTFSCSRFFGPASRPASKGSRQVPEGPGSVRPRPRRLPPGPAHPAKDPRFRSQTGKATTARIFRDAGRSRCRALRSGPCWESFRPLETEFDSRRTGGQAFIIHCDEL